MKFINSEKVVQSKIFSHIVEVGGFYYFSGIVARDVKTKKLVSTSVEVEVNRVIEIIKDLLIEVNLKKENIVKVNIWTSNLSKGPEINKIYTEYFGDHVPARMMVEVSKLPANALLEVEIIAYKE